MLVIRFVNNGFKQYTWRGVETPPPTVRWFKPRDKLQFVNLAVRFFEQKSKKTEKNKNNAWQTKFRMLLYASFRKWTRSTVGVYSIEVPPVPIPNTVVKLNCAENTWRAAAWEDRSSPTRIKVVSIEAAFFWSFSVYFKQSRIYWTCNHLNASFFFINYLLKAIAPWETTVRLLFCGIVSNYSLSRSSINN